VITPKATRLAGVSKIDLSHYPNNNINGNFEIVRCESINTKLEQDVVHNVDKCFDKNAKIHFHLKMIKVSDILPEKKDRKKAKEDKDKSKGSNGLESDDGREYIVSDSEKFN